MFDFQATLDEADQANAEGNYALAVFDYWLIDFAFQDEEFPFYYTPMIGMKARKMFFKLMKKHKNEILDSESYIEMKESLKGFKTYQKYFTHFERVVKAFQENRVGWRRRTFHKKDETPKTQSWIDDELERKYMISVPGILSEEWD